jgi:hypothetical protein
MKDLMNRIHPVMVLAPNAAITDNTAKVGAIVDRKNFESLTYVLLTGTDADADAAFTVLLEESDDSGMSGAVAVDDVRTRPRPHHPPHRLELVTLTR